MRVVGLLVCLAAAWSLDARAEPPSEAAAAGAPDAPDAHDTCEGVPPRNRLGRYDLLGGGAVHAVARTGEHYVLYPADPEHGCEVFPLLAAVGRIEGHFGFGTQAYVLRAHACGGGSCPTIVAFRGKSARALRVVRTGLDCDDTAALRLVKLFPHRDVAELICRTSAGAGAGSIETTETIVLYDASDDDITPIFQLATGSYITPSPDEAKHGMCPMVPVGGIRIEQPGVLRVIDPLDPPDALSDGKGLLYSRQLAYDPAAHQFAPTRAPAILTRVDAHRCSARR